MTCIPYSFAFKIVPSVVQCMTWCEAGPGIDIHRECEESLPNMVLSSAFTLMHAFMWIRVDHGSAIYVDLPLSRINQLRFVLNAASRLIDGILKFVDSLRSAKQGDLVVLHPVLL